MALRDVTSVIFDRGTGPFNEQAALEAYHLVAKMDDETAREFVFHVVNEVVENTITENLELVQKHLDRTIAKALVYTDLDSVAEGLGPEERQEVKKQLLAAVSKADNFVSSEHPRGEHGRFTSINSNNRLTKEDSDKLAGIGLHIPPHPDFKEMSKEQRERYRGQYAEIARHLMDHGGFDGENNVTVHYPGGKTATVRSNSPSDLAEVINPHKGQDVIGVNVTPYKPTIGGQIVDLTRSLAPGAKAGLNQVDNNFVTTWNTASPTNSTQQMYNRIGAGSRVLSAAGEASNSSHLKVAGEFGSLVGQHGSQAEAVFGPPTRKLAYRYRGTERRPSGQLVRQYGAAVTDAKRANGEQVLRRQGETINDWQKRAAREAGGRTPTWSERQNGREVIQQWLMEGTRRNTNAVSGRAPSRELTDLHLASGHTPPSEGVLLNADGQIVTTAVGSADDWYLPFNLRHLSQLKGGEYIRSRTTGGLTPEDIYTGLMSGARRVTVVSRSGVFTVEFDEELRGGRRNNDKALRMSRRYADLLDAVQSNTVQRKHDPKVEKEVQAEVAREMPGASLAEQRSEVNTRLRDRMKNPEDIDEQIQTIADHYDKIEENRQLSREERLDRQVALTNLESQKEYFWRLNGLGYEAAQHALQEQFPYYIRSMQRAINVGHDPLGGKDQGYVEPGALRPTAARANLFGTPGHEVKGKSARRADHAVPIVDRYGKGPKDEGGDMVGDREPSGPQGGSGGGGQARKLGEGTNFADAFERRGRIADAGVKALRDLPTPDKEDLPQWQALGEFRNMSDAALKQRLRNPGQAQTLVDRMDAYMDQLFIEDEHGNRARYPHPAAYSHFQTEVGPKVQGPYDAEAAMADPAAAFDFSDAKEADAIKSGKTPLALAPTAADATGEQLMQEALLIHHINQAKAEGASPQDITQVLSHEGLIPESDEGKELVASYARSPEMRANNLKAVKMEQFRRDAGSRTMALPPVDEKPASMKDQGLSLIRIGRVKGDDDMQNAGQAMVRVHEAQERGQKPSPDDVNVATHAYHKYKDQM